MNTRADDPWSRRTYFFDSGLRFACQRCGKCCTGTPGSIYVGSNEIHPIASYLGLSASRFLRTYTYPFKDSRSIGEDKDGNCLFFDGGCKIYPVRPLQCSTFPFWFSNMRSELRWRDVSRQCPGIGEGPLFDGSLIMEIALKTMHI